MSINGKPARQAFLSRGVVFVLVPEPVGIALGESERLKVLERTVVSEMIRKMVVLLVTDRANTVVPVALRCVTTELAVLIPALRQGLATKRTKGQANHRILLVHEKPLLVG